MSSESVAGFGVTAQSSTADDSDPRTAAARERILAATIEQLSENGYNGISLAHIAKRAGFTRSGLLHHFGSKEELLREALSHRLLSNAKATHVLETANADEMLETFLRMVEFTTWIRNATAAYEILAAESVSPDHPAHVWFAEQFAHARNNMAGALRRSIANGEVRPDIDVDAIALQLAAIGDGLQLHWLHDESLDTVGSARYLVELIRADIFVTKR